MQASPTTDMTNAENRRDSMMRFQTTIDGQRWDALSSGQLRKALTEVGMRYKPDGVVSLDDSEGSWTCVVDGDFREQPRNESPAGRVDIEVIAKGIIRSPSAIASVERKGNVVEYSGRGVMSGEAELRGFAALLESRIIEVGSLEPLFCKELEIGLGPVEEGPDQGVWQAVFDHALNSPSKTAIEDGTLSTSYEQLVRHMVHNSRQIASFVAPRDNVAVIIERGMQNAVAQLAVFHADCAVVLVDPTQPLSRIRAQLEQSDARLLIIEGDDDRFREIASATGAHLVSVDLSNEDQMDLQAEKQCAPKLDLDATSHVAFTSGSTGIPKAVELRHGPMSNTAVAIASASGLSSSSRASWFCPPGVGLVEVDLFPSLWVGATVVVAPDNIGNDPRIAWTWFKTHNISHSQLPTALAEQLIKLDSLAPEQFESLRVAGERLNVWPSAGTTYQVLNVYGSTEANVVALCDVTELARDMPLDRMGIVPIGRSVRNVNIYVLDDGLNPVPRRVVGELCISGRSVSRGYLNNAEQQNEKFIVNPVKSDPFPVLYRSGDLARIGRGGTIEVLGRIDGELKIDGVRVHPAEVEHELLGLDAINSAAVVAHESTENARTLVAYISAGARINVDDVRSYLEARLPSSSVPRHFIVGELPMGRNGKIDRLSLSERPLDRPEMSVPFSSPRNTRERDLCAAFAYVLGLESIGADDNFFELGGGSLQAARLIERSLNELGIDLDFVLLVDHPTPRLLAEELSLCEVPQLPPNHGNGKALSLFRDKHSQCSLGERS